MLSHKLCAWTLISAAALIGISRPATGQRSQNVREPNAHLTANEIAGLYQMLDPRGYADAFAAATYLRLLPDGRSRLEGVVVSDVNGSIKSVTEIGNYHRTRWTIQRTAAGPELCFDVAGKSLCSQVERDLATNDLLLFNTARPRAHADLRLHRIRSQQASTKKD
jgi:hypothetical protein